MAILPTAWVQAYSAAVLRVAAKLGVKAEAERNSKHDCLFIRVKPSSQYDITLDTSNNVKISGYFHEDSNRNTNSTGFDWHNLVDENGIMVEYITVNTEIGVKNGWYNEKLFPKLYDHEIRGSRYALSKHYAADYTFDHKIRINRIQTNIYAFIEWYPISQLANVLKNIISDRIYINYITPTDAIAKLQSLGIQYSSDKENPINRLRRYRYDYYNWLNQLAIISPKVSLEGILNGDPATMKQFEEYIATTIKGILLIDWIYQH